MKKIRIFLFINLFLLNAFYLEARRIQAYIVAEADTGKILCQKNANKKCFPASLVKKMTLYLLFEAIQKKKIHFKTKFKVSKCAAQQMRSKLNVKEGDFLTVKTIIEALIIKSANDVAVVAAEGLSGSVERFVNLMNQKAQQLKMRSTTFCNPSGVPHPRQKTTARDMAILARALYKDFPGFVDLFKMRSFVYKDRTHYTHNHLLNDLQGTNGIKTGYTDASGYNISVSITRYDPLHKSHQFICIKIGGDSRKARDQEVISLLEPIFLKHQAVFYNANAAVLSRKAGIPLLNKYQVQKNNMKPIFIRAPICTQNGMKLLLNQYNDNKKNNSLVALYSDLNVFFREKR